MDKFYGIYSGIVIGNSGREGGRDIPGGYVLVKINGLTPSRYTESYRAVPASNTDGRLDEEFARDFEVLARVVTPIIGESAMGKYNATLNKNSITDVTTVPGKFGTDNDLIPPSAGFQLMTIRTKSSDQHNNVIAKNNPYGNSFYPDHRYRAGKGVYAIPERNTRVAVMFENGDRAAPIVVGKLPEDTEIEGFYNKGGIRPGYPGPYQNQART